MFPAVSGKLSPASFSEPQYGRLWGTMMSLSERGLRFSSENLSRDSGLDSLWLLELSSDLATYDLVALPGEAEVQQWASGIAKGHERRQLESLLLLASKRLDRHEDTAEWLAEQLLTLRREGEGDESFEAALGVALNDVLEQPHGIGTGLGALDLLLNGLLPGRLLVIGGRPGQGKTALALGMAAYQAMHLELPVHFFSLEMTRPELALRLLCCLADISATQLRSGELDDKDWNKLERVAKRIAKLPLLIDDCGALTVAELCARARAGKAGAIYVDYVQLLSGEGASRALEVSHISRSLKVLAKSMQAPVVALSQFRRMPPGVKATRPSMYDLKESSGLEQDADAVLLLWRREVEEPDDPTLRGRAELIVEKNRHGAVADLSVAFVGESTSFVNMEMA